MNEAKVTYDLLVRSVFRTKTIRVGFSIFLTLFVQSSFAQYSLADFDIEGDLIEHFRDNVEEKGLKRSRIMFSYWMKLLLVESMMKWLRQDII